MDRSVIDFINEHAELINEGDIEKIYDACSFATYSDVIMALIDAGADLHGGEDEDPRFAYSFTSMKHCIGVQAAICRPNEYSLQLFSEYQSNRLENYALFKSLKAAVDFLPVIRERMAEDPGMYYPTVTTLNGNDLIEVKTDFGVVYMLDRGFDNIK